MATTEGYESSTSGRMLEGFRDEEPLGPEEDGVVSETAFPDNSNNDNKGALSSFAKLAADEDIDDALAKKKKTMGRRNSWDTGSITARSIASAVQKPTTTTPQTTTTTTTTAPSAVGEQPTDTTSASSPPPPGLRWISRPVLRFLTVLAGVGCLLSMAALIVGIIALLVSSDRDDDNDALAAGMELVEDLFGDSSSFSDSTSSPDRSLLDVIYERGVLQCGLVALQPGFFFPRDGGRRSRRLEEEESPSRSSGDEYVGLDVDLCRALAAAVVGDATAFEPHRFGWDQRWTKLNNSVVDVLFRSTHNMERDFYIPEIGTGVEFSSPYFYDGVGFGGIGEYVDCAETFRTNGTCAELKICVPMGTNTQDIVAGLFPSENVVAVSSSVESFPAECNVIAAAQNQVTELALRQQGYRGEYVVGTELISKEPIGLVTLQGDPTWTDFVEFVFQSLVYAEERGITQMDAAERMPLTNLFGPRYESMFRNAVAAGGNYGEIYDRNLESLIPRAGLNRLNTGEAAVWSLPLGNIQVESPAIEYVSTTVAAVKERGFLRCGKFDQPGFSTFRSQQGTYAGFDIDICRAISAALFDGVARYQLVDTDFNRRWTMLREGDVDILAFANTWTVERDVKEPVTMTGYTFAGPHIHLWSGFGGLPEFVTCADALDVASPECQGLRICTFGGTAFYNNLREALGSDFYLVPKNNPTEILVGLLTGECNVVFSSRLTLSENLVRSVGYPPDRPYVVGSSQFNLEPYGMVTRQDDQVWADFVRWVIWSLIYAEEEGITQATADLMPRPTNFGPFRVKAFYHAVNAVGNYGEIYARHLQPFFPREGRNNLNDHNQPLLYPISGFDK